MIIPWGAFRVEVIFFPRGEVPGGSRDLFGLPIWRKNLRTRPRGYFFMLRSILILLDLDIPLKSQKISKNRIYIISSFSKFDQIMISGYGSACFFTLIPNPTSTPAQTRLKSRFYQKSEFYGTSTLNAPYSMGPWFKAMPHGSHRVIFKRPPAGAAARRILAIFRNFRKNRIFRKIGQNRFLNPVWADLDSRFGFSVKNRSYS